MPKKFMTNMIFSFCPKLQYGSLWHFYSPCFYLKFLYFVHHGFFALILILKTLLSSIYLG